MQSTLSFLIFIGLLVWGFLMYDKAHPGTLFTIHSKTQIERCAKYGYDVEGDRTLSYGDRIKEVMHGCW